MGRLRKRLAAKVMKKYKNLTPAQKKQIAALLASPLPPLTKRLLIAKVAKGGAINLKKAAAVMATVATGGAAGSVVATGIASKRLLKRIRSRRSQEESVDSGNELDDVPAQSEPIQEVVSVNEPLENVESVDTVENVPDVSDEDVELVSGVVNENTNKKLLLLALIAAGIFVVVKSQKRRK